MDRVITALEYLQVHHRCRCSSVGSNITLGYHWRISRLGSRGSTAGNRGTLARAHHRNLNLSFQSPYSAPATIGLTKQSENDSVLSGQRSVGGDRNGDVRDKTL